jgi:hypothetical protein
MKQKFAWIGLAFLFVVAPLAFSQDGNPQPCPTSNRGLWDASRSRGPDYKSQCRYLSPMQSPNRPRISKRANRRIPRLSHKHPSKALPASS